MAGGVKLTDLPEKQKMPADIVKCLNEIYGPPPAGEMSEAAAAVFMDGFNIHDVGKTQCGRRAIAWAEDRYVIDPAGSASQLFGRPDTHR